MVKEEMVSVIVPVYNVEDYLDRCVESIVNQTYKNIEILLMDDASTDESGAKCDKWEKRDTRIKVFHLQHGGLSAARNSGLAQMQGQYILFVDSDDYIMPDLIWNAYANLQKYDADMTLFGFNNFYKEEENKEIPRDKEVGLISKEQIMYMMYGPSAETAFLAWNKLYKRKIFEDIRYPVGRIFEDNAVAHKVYDKCQKVVYDRNAYYLRQMRDDSITGKCRVFNRKNLQILYGRKERCEFYGDIENKELLALVFADYLHTLIHYYHNTFYYLKDKSICKMLSDEFNKMYPIATGKVKFDLKKKIGYFAFRYFPKAVSFGIHITGTGKM